MCCPSHTCWYRPLTFVLVASPHIRSATFRRRHSYMHLRCMDASSRRQVGCAIPYCIFDAWAQPHDVMPPRIHSAAGCQHHFNMHLRCMGASSYIKYSVHAVGLDIFSSRCNLCSHKCLGELVCFNNAVYGYLL